MKSFVYLWGISLFEVKLTIDLSKSKAYYEEACRYAPGGSPDGKGWGPEQFYVAGAHGSQIEDIDGNRYIDYHAGAGPIILGHSDQEVNRAVLDTMHDTGVQFAQPHCLEVELTKKLQELIPGADKSALCNAGTDALQLAVRLARTHTGRSKVVKFEGAYHGWSDGLAISTNPDPDVAGTMSDPQAVPDTSGTLPSTLQDTIVIPYNDLDIASERLEKEKHNIACVIVEPIIHGHGILPKDGFLQGLSELCRSCSILFVLDEIITGFRHDLGGLQRKWNIDVDLAVYGKAMANGYVMSAITGKNQFMDHLTPGPAFLSGTYNGNPVSAAASLKTMEILERPGFYDRLYAKGAFVREEINKIINELGLNAIAYGYGSVWALYFDKIIPSNYRDITRYLRNGGKEKYTAYFRFMLNNGIFIPPGRVARNYIYQAHSDDDLQKTVDVTTRFLREFQSSLR